MLAYKRRNEKITVVVTRLHADRHGVIRFLSSLLQQRCLQLLLQEIVGIALVYQYRQAL